MAFAADPPARSSRFPEDGVTGLFVALEGPEGAGKSTLAAALVRRLRAAGREVIAVREPGGTPVAEAARVAFLEPAFDATPLAELFLLLAARADLVDKVIRPGLARGAVVVADRFDLSTEAYQIAGRGLEPGGVRAANRLATGGLRPDLTLVVDVPADVGLARQAAQGKVPDRLERADAAFHARVAAAFDAAAGPGVVHLDGTAPPDAVEDAAWRAVAARLGKQSATARVP
jgi:dTMP kinase